MMNKIESSMYMVTRLIKDRTAQEGFTLEEYRELLRKVRDFCMDELRGWKR